MCNLVVKLGIFLDGMLDLAAQPQKNLTQSGICDGDPKDFTLGVEFVIDIRKKEKCR